MAGLRVIINPHARGNRDWKSIRAGFLSVLGEGADVVVTHDLADLDACLERFSKQHSDVLAVCGGDGTFYHVLEKALAVWGEAEMPAFVPLRGGTINNLARTVGTDSSPVKVLGRVAAAQREGRPLEVIARPLIRVNGKHYGQIVGAGLITHFLEVYYEGKHPGPVRAFAMLVVLFFSNLFGTRLIRRVVPTVPARVTTDRAELPFKGYTIVIASSIDHIGLGVRAFYRAGESPETFHLLAGASTPGQLLRRLHRFFMGLPAGIDTLYDDVAGRVRIEFESPEPYTINGELFDPVDALDLETGPSVRFVRA